MGVCSVVCLFEDNMSANTKLWDSVFMTDPQAVKQITGKSYKGNSPKPYWLIQRATETFGPVGIGWGCNVKSERFERVTETDVLHVCVVSVWYVLDGKRSETFDQMGGTKAVYQSKNGMVVDDDAGKKSVTDAMVKCLSMIGFAGDIFSGMWDDSKYVEQAGQTYRHREYVRQFASKNDLTPERAEVVMAIADEAIALFEKDDSFSAYAQYITLEDNAEKLACWSLLREHSALRSAIKKHGEEQRKRDDELAKMKPPTE